jgi:hypothetical protein
MREYRATWVMVTGTESRTYEQRFPALDESNARSTARDMAGAIDEGTGGAWRLAIASITVDDITQATAELAALERAH